ncbi:hypothetical protein B0H14DRAFT_3886049 [Mycena olivaceomarginata]|nr:hypothetical protein B0H14DRAFT_3886049 [Mycena olivaceomarginata]
MLLLDPLRHLIQFLKILERYHMRLPPGPLLPLHPRALPHVLHQALHRALAAALHTTYTPRGLGMDSHPNLGMRVVDPFRAALSNAVPWSATSKRALIPLPPCRRPARLVPEGGGVQLGADGLLLAIPSATPTLRSNLTLARTTNTMRIPSRVRRACSSRSPSRTIHVADPWTATVLSIAPAVCSKLGAVAQREYDAYCPSLRSTRQLFHIIHATFIPSPRARPTICSSQHPLGGPCPRCPTPAPSTLAPCPRPCPFRLATASSPRLRLRLGTPVPSPLAVASPSRLAPSARPLPRPSPITFPCVGSAHRPFLPNTFALIGRSCAPALRVRVAMPISSCFAAASSCQSWHARPAPCPALPVPLHLHRRLECLSHGYTGTRTSPPVPSRLHVAAAACPRARHPGAASSPP